MITAKQIKEVVERNRKHININSRVDMENMIYLTFELLKVAGYEDAAYFTRMLYDEIENMDTLEIAREKIWVG